MREGERERPLLGGGDRPLQMTQHTFSAINFFARASSSYLNRCHLDMQTRTFANGFKLVAQLRRASHW